MGVLEVLLGSLKGPLTRWTWMPWLSAWAVAAFRSSSVLIRNGFSSSYYFHFVLSLLSDVVAAVTLLCSVADLTASQCTFQCCNINEARYFYDQLAVFAPIMVISLLITHSRC
jgi:hypothetical protein